MNENTAQKLENEVSEEEQLDLEVEVIDDTPDEDKNKTRNEITLIVENNSITSSLKKILNNFDIEDLYINEPPVDEIIGKILIKKTYDI